MIILSCLCAMCSNHLSVELCILQGEHLYFKMHNVPFLFVMHTQHAHVHVWRVIVKATQLYEVINMYGHQRLHVHVYYNRITNCGVTEHSH